MILIISCKDHGTSSLTVWVFLVCWFPVLFCSLILLHLDVTLCFLLTCTPTVLPTLIDLPHLPHCSRWQWLVSSAFTLCLVHLFSSHSPVTPVVIFPLLCIPVSFAYPHVLPVFCIFFPLDIWIVSVFVLLSSCRISLNCQRFVTCILYWSLDNWNGFQPSLKDHFVSKVDFWVSFLIELGWWPVRPTIPKCIWRFENDSRSTFLQNRYYIVCFMLPCLHLGPVIPEYLPSWLFTQLFKRWLEILVIL